MIKLVSAAQTSLSLMAAVIFLSLPALTGEEAVLPGQCACNLSMWGFQAGRRGDPISKTNTQNPRALPESQTPASWPGRAVEPNIQTWSPASRLD